jgi:hypothetical protein
MNAQQLGQLILFIVSQANDHRDTVTTIRLVKFLYLIDLEYYRIKGRLLTGLRWIFYKYGPYALELKQIGERIGYQLEREEFVHGIKKGVVFTVDSNIEKPAWLGYTEESIIDRILEVWSGIDTEILLDYVYNRTEPMNNAVRGQPLVFSVIKPGTHYYELNVSIDQKKGQEILKSLREALKEESSSLGKITTTGDLNFLETSRSIDLDDWSSPISSNHTSEIDPESGILLGDI